MAAFCHLGCPKKGCSRGSKTVILSFCLAHVRLGFPVVVVLVPPTAYCLSSDGLIAILLLQTLS